MNHRECGNYISKENGTIVLSAPEQITRIYCEEIEWSGIRHAALDLCRDFERITGRKGQLITDPEQAQVLLGSLERSSLVSELISCGKLDVSEIQGSRESFLIRDMEGKLLITGSDQRGTIYGIYDLCQKMGVSPWYWWADVPIKPAKALYADLPEPYIEEEPSVTYRGIFLNDEYALDNWAAQRGDQSFQDLYARVYELLLRLKANTLWPAMHMGSPAFHAYPQNPAMAAEYGIVIGTSHCEPMLRNNELEYLTFEESWEHEHPDIPLFKKKLPDSPRACAYVWIDKDPDTGTFVGNKQLILDYWKESIEKFGRYECIFTVGMRGLHDAGWQPEGADSLLDRAKQMEEILAAQRKLLEDTLGKPAKDIPQLFIPYKEIQEIYDAGMQIPEDIMIMWSDDNFGYLRQTASPEEQMRSGGTGIYYHVGYHGDPNSYIWQCNTPFALMRQELCKGYDSGAKNIWILNVGDLKPAEKQIEYFCDLARNVPSMKKQDLRNWVSKKAMRDFGFSEKKAKEFADIEIGFQQLVFVRKPEHFRNGLFLLEENGDEGQHYIDDYQTLVRRSESLQQSLEEDAKAAFFQLQLYPLRTCADTAAKFIYADKAVLYAEQKRGSCVNWYTAKSDAAYYRTVQDTLQYEKQCRGKWRWIMDPWQSAFQKRGAVLPNILSAARVVSLDYADLGTAPEKPFHVFRGITEERFLDLYNTGSGFVEWWIESAPEWLKFSEKQGIVCRDQRITITLDWTQVPKGSSDSDIKICWYNSKRCLCWKTEKLHIENIPIEEFPVGTCFETGGKISISVTNPSRFIRKSGAEILWVIQKDLGRTGISLRSEQKELAEKNFPENRAASQVDYSVWFASAGNYQLRLYRLPTLNERGKQRVEIALDNQNIRILSGNSMTGTENWAKGVLANVEVLETEIVLLSAGLHEITLKPIDEGCVVERIELYKKNVEKAALF